MNPATTLGWYWHRLRAMDAGEVAERVLETARGWTAQSASRVLDNFRIGNPVSTSPRLPNRLEAPEGIGETLRGEAASIRAGRWVLFGWNEVHVPSPPVWYRDYAHSADAPHGIDARSVNYRHLAGGADARWVWETNRWAEMVRLAQNAWLNGVLADARLAQEWLLDWCEKNPTGIGINWCSSLEAGLRLINFCWIDVLVRDCGDENLTTVQNRLAQQIVPSHAWWIWRHRSFGSSANNHLLGELASLVLAAARWPSLARVACSAERAWGRMVPEILRQFAEDGGNREQALHYHQFAWEMAWQAARVMESGQGPSAERLSKAGRFFCDLVHDREPWDFGDSDDSQITPLTSERRTALSEWKAWFQGKEQGAALRFWLGDPPADILPLRPGRWIEYPITGLVVLEVNGWKARLDGSPLGLGSMAAHGHLDAMHLSLWDREHALVVDPGTGAYFGNPEVRTKLASWELHNGPIPVAGRPRPRRMGPFMWARHHATPQLTLDGGACSVRFACAGSSIKRTVQCSADANVWRVTDEISGDDPHVVRWRLAPEWRAVSPSAPGITIAHTKGAAVTLAVASDGLIGCEVGEDVVSPRFGDLQRGVVITVTFKKRLVSQWQRAEATRPE